MKNPSSLIGRVMLWACTMLISFNGYADHDQIDHFSLAYIWEFHRPLMFIGPLILLIILLLLGALGLRNRQLNESKNQITEVLTEQDAILSAIPEFMMEMDQYGTYLNVWARTVDEMTASKSVLLGKNVFDVLPETEAQKVIDALRETIRTGRFHGLQIRQGEQQDAKWFELSISLKHNITDPFEFIVLSRDITDTVNNQLRLKSSQERYRGLFENMADGVMIFLARDQAAEFVVVECNQACERLDNIDRSMIIGNLVSEVLPSLEKWGLIPVLRRVWKTGVSERFPATWTEAYQVKGWRDYFIYRLKSGEVVAIFSDQTAQKLAELELKENENQKQLIINTIPDLMWLKDQNGVYMMSNPRHQRFFGATESQIVGKSDYDFVDKELADFFLKHDQYAMESDTPIVNEEWVTFATDGSRALLETTKTPLKNWDGRIIGVLGIGHDITERHEANETRKLSASVFEHSHEGIVITDKHNHIVDANPACLQLTGYDKDELVGKNPRIFSSGKQTKQFYQTMWQELKNNGHWSGEIENRKKSGEVYTERLIIDEVTDEKGDRTHYVGVFSDITYMKEQEKELERVAYSDALTGLPNRLLLHDRMRQAFRLSERSNKMVSVCYLDLDGFKPINDEYGHEAGDEVLVEVAQRLKASLRNGDTVARLGGDEFVLLILNVHSIYELEQMLDRILQSVIQPHRIQSGGEVTVSASIGIALFPLDDSDPDTLLRHADQAMYNAKNLGKNRYSFFDPSEEKRATETHGLIAAISSAIDNNEFFMVYQPKVNMHSGVVIGVEALIRWNHPVRGVLGPVEFLPVIEHNSLIVDLGNWVMLTVFEQIRLWREQGKDVNVSINIAALQLQRHDFVEHLKSLLTEFSDIQPHHLELEILETAALHDIKHVSRIMRDCEELGVSFALDDFGTGYSSLTYLKQLPAQVLKIDQSFIRDLLDDPDDIAITEGILGLTQAFHRTAIAEGVETLEHGRLLLQLGCLLGQGYGIARPMEADKIPQWIEEFEKESEWHNLAPQMLDKDDDSLLLMAVEHHRMVSQVLNAVEQNLPALLPDKLDDDHACRFGEWLDQQGQSKFGHLDMFEPMMAHHHQLHHVCGLTAEALKQDDHDKLKIYCKELRQLRREILDSLNAMRNIKDQSESRDC